MTEIDPSTIRKQSVTENEQRVTALNYYMLPYLLYKPLVSLPPDAPVYWSYARDITLRSTLHAETMWAAAVGIAATKCTNAGYALEGGKRKVAWAHDMLGNVDFARGWKYFVSRTVRDYLTTDNGSFVEIVRATSAAGSKVVGLAHLDSLRCRRTGDDETPVVYRDLVGAEHALKWHQVFSVVDMPAPEETLRGVGYCAASRAYGTIYKLAGIERYISEKTSGRRPLEVTFVSGISQKQLETAIQSAHDEADRKGLTTYMGVCVVPTNTPEGYKLEVVSVPLAAVPDWVKVDEERKDAYLRYADCIGLDPQELQPLTHGSSNTATQSVVLDEKERGKFGWFEAFAEQLNLHKIVGGAVTFTFSHKDWRDQQLEAGVRLQRAQTRSAQILSGEISTDESRQIAAQSDDIPQEFLDKEVIDQQTLYDDDNPDQIADAQDDAGASAFPSPEAPPAGAKPEPAPVASAPRAAVPVPKEAAPATPQEPSAKRVIARGLGRVKTKARGAVDLATLSPGRMDDLYYNEAPASKLKAFIKAVEKELEEYGDILTQAAYDECPQRTGELARSIGYEIQNRGTKDVQLHVYAGNRARPEVVVRSNLYGRRGFGPKDPHGVLHFESADGEDVFVKRVGPAEANDWFGRAWDRTEPQRSSMIGRIGRLEKDLIDVSDADATNAEHIDGYKPGKRDKPAKVIKERVPVVHGTNGHSAPRPDRGQEPRKEIA